jgi:hypothetical protein
VRVCVSVCARVSEKDRWKVTSLSSPHKHNLAEEDSLKSEGYTWSQTLGEVEVRVKAPTGTTKKDVKAEFRRGALKVTFGKDAPAIDKKLAGFVQVDGCTWTINTNQAIVTFTLEKEKEGDWESLFA